MITRGSSARLADEVATSSNLKSRAMVTLVPAERLVEAATIVKPKATILTESQDRPVVTSSHHFHVTAGLPPPVPKNNRRSSSETISSTVPPFTAQALSGYEDSRGPSPGQSRSSTPQKRGESSTSLDTSEKKRTKTSWTEEEERCLLEYLLQSKTKFIKDNLKAGFSMQHIIADKGLKTTHWTAVAAYLSQRLKIPFDAKKCKNKYGLLKSKYIAAKKLKSSSGLGAAGLPLDEEVREEMVEDDPDFETADLKYAEFFDRLVGKRVGMNITLLFLFFF